MELYVYIANDYTNTDKRKLAKCLGIRMNGGKGTRQIRPVTSGERRFIRVKKKRGRRLFLKNTGFC